MTAQDDKAPKIKLKKLKIIPPDEIIEDDGMVSVGGKLKPVTEGSDLETSLNAAAIALGAKPGECDLIKMQPAPGKPGGGCLFIGGRWY